MVPERLRHLPNLISVLRRVLVVPIAWSLVRVYGRRAFEDGRERRVHPGVAGSRHP